MVTTAKEHMKFRIRKKFLKAAVFSIALLLSSILITQYKGGEKTLTEGVYHDELEEHGEVDDILWNKEHNISWISPYEKYLPLMFRVDEQGLIYYEDPYLVIRVHAVTDHFVSWLAFGKTFHFGTYEWKAKAVNDIAKAIIYLGILEKRHGWADEGIISIYWNGTNWVFATSNEAKGGAGSETTNIAGIDFTVEHTFKIEWTSTYVKFYIDGVLKATHTTKVPQDPMQLFAEVGTDPSIAPASEPESQFRAGSFKEL